MLDRKIYKLMKKKYSDVGSWAVWDEQLDKARSNKMLKAYRGGAKK